MQSHEDGPWSVHVRGHPVHVRGHRGPCWFHFSFSIRGTSMNLQAGSIHAKISESMSCDWPGIIPPWSIVGVCGGYRPTPTVEMTVSR